MNPLVLPFSETNVVVTGSSSGIGRATAIALAQAGASKLVVHYHRNRAGATETAKLATDAGCPDVSVIQADLGEHQSRQRFVDEAFETLGQVDAWINLAGADVLTGEAAEMSFAEKLTRLWNVDVYGTIELSRCVAKKLQSQATSRPPSITFVGWDQAPHGMEGDAGQMFGPVKAAVMAFANSLAQELAPEIRVNTVAPGWIQTSWGETTSPYWDARAKGQSLMQRWGRPEDVAAAIAYLANPANTFTTGQTLNANGGWNRQFQ
ncbi:3-oxoacyl-[acyl-carrier-protein] reductase FabG [Rubripirellula amarantea]|uniref:3-oxoacyl-[acyl-carrier-protein] reductase FabG n=1 Tax=Rubripirellula amarantea TaxID=2527999 RepID=A0A5C5WPX4_9BACT|nr:SDR family oxidoreductase [Rubripirellula amarantea]TWT52816.1 3-oxoacyl-[acyl-carrier-protein] reductase FabG [Rubripirellula amarantea]